MLAALQEIERLLRLKAVFEGIFAIFLIFRVLFQNSAITLRKNLLGSGVLPMSHLFFFGGQTPGS